MWDLPRPGHEPVSPALAGGLPTTAPPGKPWILYIFWILTSYQLDDLQILFPLRRLPFYFVDGFFLLCRSLLAWCSPTCLFLLLLPDPEDRCQDRYQWASYCLYFLLCFYGFKCYIQVFYPFWVNFCVWCNIVVQSHSFACGCPVFPTPLETLLSSLCILGSCVVN